MKMCCLQNFFETDPELGISFSSFSNWNSRSSKYKKCLPLGKTLDPVLHPQTSSCCGQFSGVYGNPVPYTSAATPSEPSFPGKRG